MFEARKGISYMPTTESVNMPNFDKLGRLYYDYKNGIITRFEAVKRANNLDREINNFDDLESMMLDTQMPVYRVNKAHLDNSTILPKDVYIIRDNDYLTGAIPKKSPDRLYSATLVDPYEIFNKVLYEKGLDDAINIYKIPKGSKITLVDSDFKEVVVPGNVFHSSKSIKGRYFQKAMQKVAKKYKQLGGDDVKKLFSLIPIAGIANKTQENNNNVQNRK